MQKTRMPANNFLKLLSCQRSRRHQQQQHQLMSTKSKFEIWRSECQPKSANNEKQPIVLLMGHAGAKRHQLRKFEQLYEDLGYRTLSCVMPRENLFCYDIAAVRECAEDLFAALDRLSWIKNLYWYCHNDNIWLRDKYTECPLIFAWP